MRATAGARRPRGACGPARADARAVVCSRGRPRLGGGRARAGARGAGALKTERGRAPAPPSHRNIAFKQGDTEPVARTFKLMLPQPCKVPLRVALTRVQLLKRPSLLPLGSTGKIADDHFHPCSFSQVCSNTNDVGTKQQAAGGLRRACARSARTARAAGAARDGGGLRLASGTRRVGGRGRHGGWWRAVGCDCWGAQLPLGRARAAAQRP